VDPRPAVIERRLASVGRIIAVTGGKGGIGKSSVAVGLALAFAARGLRVGLLDLDLHGPSDHVILGIARPTFEEDGGLVPMTLHGVTFMSITGIIGADAALLRGEDVTNAILELLAVVRWGPLDVLVVDMPPGFGEALLDSVRYVPRAEYIVVATPSPLALETTRKTVGVLARLGLPVLGVVGNMVRSGAPGVPSLGDLAVLGAVGYEQGYEALLGDVTGLMGSAFGAAMRGVAERIAAGR
jgi:ATP-binding protein involved in chromosome partitioning